MDLEEELNNGNNLNEYISVKNIWEDNASQNSERILTEAQEYLNNLPVNIGPGPSTALILDLHTSEFKSHTGNFKEVFGMDFIANMTFTSFAPFVHPRHNKFMLEHLALYIKHMISLSPEERNLVDLSVTFKFKRGSKYYWISLRTFKYFSDRKENLGFVNAEYVDITSIKKDNWAKFIVYDKQKGYIINDVLHSNCFTLDCLTPTELEITKLTAKGRSDKEIADVRGSAINTIKQHKRHIFSKLKINKATELVAIAYECGLVKN